MPIFVIAMFYISTHLGLTPLWLCVSPVCREQESLTTGKPWRARSRTAPVFCLRSSQIDMATSLRVVDKYDPDVGQVAVANLVGSAATFDESFVRGFSILFDVSYSRSLPSVTPSSWWV